MGSVSGLYRGCVLQDLQQRRSAADSSGGDAADPPAAAAQGLLEVMQ